MTDGNRTGTGPTQSPPVESASGDGRGGTSAPSVLMDEPGLSAATTDSGPTLLPPEAALAAGEDTAVTATWHNNVKVDALWVIDESRNAWLRVAGGAWKRIYGGRDGAFQALVTLASQARQTGRPVNLREEADGMIYEIYLW